MKYINPFNYVAVITLSVVLENNSLKRVHSKKYTYIILSTGEDLTFQVLQKLKLKLPA
jgi:hypothetical protein